MDELLIPFDDNGNGFSRYDANERYIGDVIESWLRSCNVEQYDIEEVQAFDSVAYESSVLCVAWVAANGKLNTCNLLLEMR